MPTWLYRASNYKAGPTETWEIVERFGFVHRTLYCRGVKQRVANVGSVAIGDFIHLYYAGDLNVGQDFGLFRVVDPKDHSQPALFATPVSKSALYTIATGTLHERLLTAQYEPDSHFGVLCGWPVVRVEGLAPRQVAPGIMFALFPTRNSLVRAS